MCVCFFLGHSMAPSSLFPALEGSIARHVERYGVTSFLVGHYGAFDDMAFRAALAVKQRYPYIAVQTLIAYHPSREHPELSARGDGSLYPPGAEHISPRFAISYANRWAIDNSDYLIAYVHDGMGHCHAFFRRAKKRERRGLLHVENLAPDDSGHKFEPKS